jgi:signal transduction histidine kinase
MTSFKVGSHRVFSALFGALLGLAAVTSLPPPAMAAEVASFQEWYGMSPEALAQGHPVRIDGVVLCYDAGWGQLYIHDDQQTAYFSPGSFPIALIPGQAVQLTGSTAISLDGSASLTDLQVALRGEGKLPHARKLTLSQLHLASGDWVEVEGRVRGVDTSRGRLGLLLHDQGHRCLVYVLGELQPILNEELVGSKVRVRGINSSRIADGHLQAASIFAPGRNEVFVIEHPPPTMVPPQVTSIGALLGRELGSWTNQPVEISGLVTSSFPGQRISVEDPTGFISANVIQETPVQSGQRVRLQGYLEVAQGEALLRDATFTVAQPQVGATGASAMQEIRPESASELPVLNRISRILQLPRSEQPEYRTVKVQGVVTFADVAWETAFIQDGDHAVFGFLKDPSIQAGQWVEVSGQVEPGGFAPQLIQTSFNILGTRPLPVPVRADLEDLMHGHLDARWIEMEGVVRRVTLQWQHLTLDVVTPKGNFLSVLPNYLNSEPPRHLVDAIVRVRGACTSRLNARGQLLGFTLNTPSLDDVEILEAGPSDPFATAAIPIASMATFDPSRIAGRRVKVSGVATLVMPGRGLFLEDATGGLRVNTDGPLEVRAGDRVDALGFPALGEIMPSLQEATLRVLGADELLPSTPTTAGAILLDGLLDGRRVRIEAQLLRDVAHSANPQLLLQDGPFTFTARLLRPSHPEQLAALQGGSGLRLDGICLVQAGPDRQPRSFQILLDSTSDMTVLSRPSWWTLRRILWTSAGLGGVLLLVLAWVALLRRQVTVRTRQLSEETGRHKSTAARLEAEAARRAAMEEEVEKKHRELLDLSHQAGMAEVATGMLHNVGNALNSVNVSADLIFDQTRCLPVDGVTQTAGLLETQSGNLAAFFASDPRGRVLPGYLGQLGAHLNLERATILEEIGRLRKNVHHIRDIVSMQQDLATPSELRQPCQLPGLIADSLRIVGDSLERRRIRVTCDFVEPLPEIQLDRHKVVQILVNILHNAGQACSASGVEDPWVNIRVTADQGMAEIAVADNGVGIAPEILGRLFQHGFTTRKDGHGFGLHSASLAARNLGGTLRVQSPGVGLGAEFVLQLPMNPTLGTDAVSSSQAPSPTASDTLQTVVAS